MTTVATSTDGRRRSRALGAVLVVAGPVAVVALFFVVLAALNAAYPPGRVASSAELALSVVALFGVPVVVGAVVTWRGLVRLHISRGAWRLILAIVVVLAGAAVLGWLCWLAGVNIQQGSASSGLG